MQPRSPSGADSKMAVRFFTSSAASPMCSSCTDGRAEPSTIPTCLLNAFLSGGWLAGFCYLALAAVTIVMSTRFLFVPTPWAAHLSGDLCSLCRHHRRERHHRHRSLAPLFPYPRLFVGFDGGFAPVCCRSAYRFRRLAPARHCLNGGTWRLLGDPLVLRAAPGERRPAPHRRSVAQPG